MCQCQSDSVSVCLRSTSWSSSTSSKSLCLNFEHTKWGTQITSSGEFTTSFTTREVVFCCITSLYPLILHFLLSVSPPHPLSGWLSQLSLWFLCWVSIRWSLYLWQTSPPKPPSACVSLSSSSISSSPHFRLNRIIILIHFGENAQGCVCQGDGVRVKSLLVKSLLSWTNDEASCAFTKSPVVPVLRLHWKINHTMHFGEICGCWGLQGTNWKDMPKIAHSLFEPFLKRLSGRCSREWLLSPHQIQMSRFMLCLN